MESSPGNGIFFPLIPAISTLKKLCFSAFGLYNDVLAYPFFRASIYGFYSSVPAFVVLLPSG